jgi:hypothetical protein
MDHSPLVELSGVGGGNDETPGVIAEAGADAPAPAIGGKALPPVLAYAADAGFR